MRPVFADPDKLGELRAEIIDCPCSVAEVPNSASGGVELKRLIEAVHGKGDLGIGFLLLCPVTASASRPETRAAADRRAANAHPGSS
mgnify:CR=1 FL=1